MQIARHKPELARKVASDDYALLPFLGPLISHPDPKLKRQAIACLSHIAYHNQSLAEQVIHYTQLAQLLKNLKDPDLKVRINTAECIKNLVRHKAESAKLFCNKDGAKALIEYVKNNDGPAREPALYAISCIASFDEGLAITIINSDAVPTLRDCLKDNYKDLNIKLRAAHALGCLGMHSEDHAKALAEKDVLKELLEIILSETKKKENRHVELLETSKEASRKIIANCKSVNALDELIKPETPSEIMVLVLRQLLRILPTNNLSKKRFAETRGLQKLLIHKEELSRSPTGGDKVIETIIDDIAKHYPPDLVNYFTPGYAEKIADKLEKMPQNSGES